MSNATKPDFVKLACDAKPTLRERNAQCDANRVDSVGNRRTGCHRSLRK